jgi:hypothetical protein
MTIGFALVELMVGLIVGLMVGSGGVVSPVSLWSGRRAGATGLVGFGLASLIGSLAVLHCSFGTHQW